MNRLDDVAVRAVRTMIAGQPDTEAKIAFAWALAAGVNLARAATVSFSGGTLRVLARTDAWRRELARAKPVLAARLGEILGPDVVRVIVITVASDSSLASNTSGSR